MPMNENEYQEARLRERIAELEAIATPLHKITVAQAKEIRRLNDELTGLRERVAESAAHVTRLQELSTKQLEENRKLSDYLSKVHSADLQGYQMAASRTLRRKDTLQNETLVAALGLCGEAGEVGEMLKKWAAHGHVLHGEMLCRELGDVLWYVAAIATLHGLSLNVVARENITKLKGRYPDGFSEERSVNRNL